MYGDILSGGRSVTEADVWTVEMQMGCIGNHRLLTPVPCIWRIWAMPQILSKHQVAVEDFVNFAGDKCFSRTVILDVASPEVMATFNHEWWPTNRTRIACSIKVYNHFRWVCYWYVFVKKNDELYRLFLFVFGAGAGLSISLYLKLHVKFSK